MKKNLIFIKSNFLGENVGSLNIYAIKNDKKETLIYSKSGTQANKWFKSNLQLSYEDISYDFSLAIDSINGGSLGDIAIDQSKTYILNYFTYFLVSIKKHKLLIVKLIIGKCPVSLRCDFEDGFCGKKLFLIKNYAIKSLTIK